MPDIFDVDPFQKYMALFVGPNGGGKSIAIASWLEVGSVYTLDFDGRMASVANWYKKRGLKQGQLLYDTYGPSNLYDAVKKLDSFLDYCPHAAVSIDSFTAVTVSAVTFSLRRRSAKGGTSLPTTSKGDMIIPDWDEFKGETVCVTQMLDICKELASKGVAVFWTAHPIVSTKIEAGKDGAKDKYGTQTRYACYGNKTDSLIPIYFNEIYHFTTEYDWETERNKRWCITSPTGNISAKTAFDIPGKIEWTDGNFRNILMSHIKEGEKPIE